MRLIDADALLAAYDRVHIGPPDGARKLIEAAPTAMKWTRVSEGLPKEYKIKDGHIQSISHTVIVMTEDEGGLMRLEFANTANGIWRFKLSPGLHKRDVIAWMPLLDMDGVV